MSLIQRSRVPSLYAICDQAAAAGRDLAEVAAELVGLGVRWLQVRAKHATDRELYRSVERVVRQTEGHDVVVWVNDRPDLARVLPVGGVHLGQDDLPPAAARGVVGEDVWIGHSTHTLEQALAADADSAVDLIAVGPVFGTASKERPDPVVGTELIREVRRKTGKPIVAIGGIDASTAAEVIEAGADAVAVISALFEGGSAERGVRALQAALDCGSS